MKELYKLYPHQQKAIDALKQAFRSGKKRPLLYASVAFGKTVVAAHLVDGALNKGNRVCFVVPFTVLINQTAKSFMNQGLPQPGIIQADHPWTDPGKRLQIASVQTLSRRKVDDFDLYIIDEAHVVYKEITSIAENTNIPFIGLSGSPFTKGLGKIYDELVITKTMSELIDEAFLSDYVAFGPCVPDMTGVKTAMGDFQQKGAAKACMDPVIVGSITDTWLKQGNDEPTICFATNVAHANYLGTAFDKIGVTNQVITARTPHEERDIIFDKFAKGGIKILVNVGTLTTGMDKDVRCIIFARPTKSKILWVQMCGRALRMADGKERAILLDHAGNFERLGYPEDIYITELDDGEKKENKASDPEVKAEKKPKVCPKCKILKDAGVHECPSCGFTPRHTEDVETVDGELTQLKGKAKKVDKQMFWNELLGYKQAMTFEGKNYSDKYLSHIYRRRFGVWPKGLDQGYSCNPTEATMGFINQGKKEYAAKMRAMNK